MSSATFKDEYQAGTYQNPVQRHERVWRNQVAFDMFFSNARHVVRIQCIRSFHRGEGWGSAGLRWLCALADKNDVVLTGVVEPCGDTRPRLTVRQLCKWYRAHGFRVRRDLIMYREPR